MATKSKHSRDLRWNFRVAEGENEIVRAASELADVNMTSFVRNAAVSEARRMLADQTMFALDISEWERFNELLDRPAEVPAGLRDLFSKPSVFE